MKVIITATHGFPDFVLPYLTKFKTGPNNWSSANALSTLELPINADNSPENVVAMMPIGTSGRQKLIDCKTWLS